MEPSHFCSNFRCIQELVYNYWFLSLSAINKLMHVLILLEKELKNLSSFQNCYNLGEIYPFCVRPVGTIGLKYLKYNWCCVLRASDCRKSYRIHNLHFQSRYISGTYMSHWGFQSCFLPGSLLFFFWQEQTKSFISYYRLIRIVI